MSISAVTRRAAIRNLGAFALLSASAVRTAQADSGVRFQRITVDVAPLRASAGDPTADWVEQALPGALAEALAAHLAPGERGAPTLIARIQFIYLGPTGGGAGPSGASQDSIRGVLIVRGARDGIAAETPLRAITTYYSMAVDTPLFEEAFHGRVVALAEAFAGWAPRELGL
jgi:hypothetical protein